MDQKEISAVIDQKILKIEGARLLKRFDSISQSGQKRPKFGLLRRCVYFQFRSFELKRGNKVPNTGLTCF